MHLDRIPFKCSREEVESQKNFKFGTSTDHFSTDRAASTAVKGLAPACKLSGLKNAHIHACKQYIWWSYTNLLSELCILIEILSPAHAKAAKSLNNFKFGLFIGRFPSDEAASMAVKGLNYVFCCTDETVEADNSRNWMLRTKQLALTCAVSSEVS